jgi:hypothetical protein
MVSPVQNTMTPVTALTAPHRRARGPLCSVAIRLN